jgi:biopolymer transport protein ExbD
MLFHSPLGLRERAPAPSAQIDFLPVAAVLLIALLLSLAGSRFIYAPGLLVQLDDDAGEAAGAGTGVAGTSAGATAAAPAAAVHLELPRSKQRALGGALTDATLVVTTRSDMAFFDGRRYRVDSPELRDAFAAAVKQHGRDSVLLLKADKTLTLERITLLGDFAREAGFKKVLLATQTTPATK